MQWLIDGWDSSKKETIINSFEFCGITVKLDNLKINQRLFSEFEIEKEFFKLFNRDKLRNDDS